MAAAGATDREVAAAGGLVDSARIETDSWGAVAGGDTAALAGCDFTAATAFAGAVGTANVC
jgi:hypothetical protein